MEYISILLSVEMKGGVHLLLKIKFYKLFGKLNCTGFEAAQETLISEQNEV